jgi:hypothetical protein
MRWFRRAIAERTCQDCGETWALQASLAHDRYSGLRRRGLAARTVITAHETPGWTYAVQQQTGVPHRRDTEAGLDPDSRWQLGICPKCGSERYTDRPVRR